MKEDKKALYDKEEFFKLPIAGIDDIGITPLYSSDQPAGFMNKEGAWVVISTDDGLMRALVS